MPLDIEEKLYKNDTMMMKFFNFIIMAENYSVFSFTCQALHRFGFGIKSNF